MQAHIVLAHPERQSFNGLLADTSQETLRAAGYDVTWSDLYRLGFDPREAPEHYVERTDTSRFHAQTEQRYGADNGTTPPDIQREIDALLACDLLVVHFPLWWFGPPAILKGWMDRSFVYGTMYRSQLRYDAGVCAGKRMIACVTTGASADSCSHDGREGDTRMHLWPFLFAYRYLGFEVLAPEVLHGIGCEFALDDFGSGLGAFSSLKHLPIDYLKIDGQFIRNVADDSVDESMVKAISEVGQAMGICTIAERVETKQVLEKLGALGVEFV